MSVPVTPQYERDEYYNGEPSVADMKDPAYSIPQTPDGKPGRESHLATPPAEVGRSYVAAVSSLPDNYVTHTIAAQKYLPPVTWKNLIWNIQWISFLALTITPALAIYGIFTTPYNTKTAIWR
jgi:stearoyl-CoA desaturase (delta-9 desaturase)